MNLKINIVLILKTLLKTWISKSDMSMVYMSQKRPFQSEQGS